jgi:hypothetical protein
MISPKQAVILCELKRRSEEVRPGGEGFAEPLSLQRYLECTGRPLLADAMLIASAGNAEDIEDLKLIRNIVEVAERRLAAVKG